MVEHNNDMTKIDDAVKRIVDQFHPAKIILFGSLRPWRRQVRTAMSICWWS